jgi:hypothetical protein
MKTFTINPSVADPDPGSEIRDPTSGTFFTPWIWDPESGSEMNFFRIPDPRGMFFGEIFLRILFFNFLLIKLALETTYKKQEKSRFYF